jgi:prepilin-type N-terminal cleavage/methylation domain-containing protein
MKAQVQESRRGFTLLELTMVICIMLVLAGLGLTGSKWVGDWKKARTASEGLRTVYIAQRTYLADNPTTQVANLTQAMLLPYLPNNAPAYPVITSLTGAALTIRVNVSPPYLTDGAGARYDPSGSNTDSLWDVGE